MMKVWITWRGLKYGGKRGFEEGEVWQSAGMVFAWPNFAVPRGEVEFTPETFAPREVA